MFDEYSALKHKIAIKEIVTDMESKELTTEDLKKILEEQISVGNVIRDKSKNTRYRVIAIVNQLVTLCEMDTTKFILSQVHYNTVNELQMSNDLTIDASEENFSFDESKLPETEREKYRMKMNIMKEVIVCSAPSFINLAGKKPKPEIKRIMENYGLQKCTFWRMCTKFFQSGMKAYSLVDVKTFGVNKGKTYQYKSKPGARPEYFESKGVVLTEEILAYFEEALREYNSGRQNLLMESRLLSYCRFHSDQRRDSSIITLKNIFHRKKRT